MPAVGNAWADFCWAAFEDFEIPQTVPSRDLFHYTDVQGFESIITSGELLATHVRYMSDHLEIAYGRRLLHQVLYDEAAHWRPEQVDFFERALLAMSHTEDGKPTPVYAVAFSEVGDDMAQWDRYGNRGVGYSLGFAPEALNQIEKTGPFLSEWDELGLRQVVYDEAVQHSLLKSLISRGVALVDSDIQEWASTEQHGLTTLARQMASHLLELLSSFKHPGFAAEREWRLTYTGGIHESEGFDALFRASPRGMIPYVKMGIPPTPETRKRVPLSQLYCGPGLARAEAPQAARAFLLLNAYQALDRAIAVGLPPPNPRMPRVIVEASSMAK